MWIGAVLTSFALMFFGINYANAIRWQIRAQNAADAAAQGVLAVQTQRWNLMLQTLYATNVEEYRLRRLLDAVLLTVDDTGGCSVNTANLALHLEFFTQGSCSESYVTLTAAYEKAAQRYTTDVQLLNDITAPATNTNWASDAQYLVAHMQDPSRCNSDTVTQAQYALDPTGGDCAFKYTIPPDGFQTRTGLEAVENDARGDLIPGLGRTATKNGVDTEAAGLFGPEKIDIVTCAKVPPLISSFGPFKAPTYYAVGRAAATAQQVEQDWFEPGALTDPTRSTPGNNQVFQPHEIYNSVAPLASPSPNAWYDVDYGGNVATAETTFGGTPYFSEPFYNNEMSARLGWWNAIPTQPFSKKVTLASACPVGS